MNPQEAFQIAQPGFQAYSAGRFGEAEQVADRILTAAPNDPNGLYLKGIARRAQRDPHGALTYLRKVDELHPGVLDIITAIGLVLSDLDMFEPALDCFQKAVDLHPGVAFAHIRQADLLVRLRRIDAAEAAARKAVELDPRATEAHLVLARVGELRRDAEAMAQSADAALVIMPQLHAANIYRARADLMRGDATAAAARLAAIAPSPEDAAQHGATLGDAYDALDQFDDARAAYDRGNQATRAFYAPQYANSPAPNTLARLSALNDQLTDMTENAVAPVPADERPVVFLVGFPRSGTTLLEQMLAAHRDLVTSDEHNCLGGVINSVLSDETGLAGLMQASDDRLAAYRAQYWAAVDQFHPTARNAVYVDKSPLNMNWLAVVGRIFPHAKVILMHRDPRDAVFSAWRRPFGMNPAMFHMLDLADASAYFDQSRRAADAGRRIHPHLSVLDVKYEGLAADPRATCETIIRHLGLDWDERIANYREHLEGRAISTPSARQVDQSVQHRTVGHWRDYEAAITPHLGVLNTWIDADGYEH